MTVGRAAFRDLLSAFETTQDPAEAYPHWLDFGCGPGRVSRLLADLAGLKTLSGVDVDSDAIEWARRFLKGSFRVVAPEGPLPFSDSSIDVVVSVSVFTHLNEESQFRWLREIRRALRPGGLFLASTHSEKLRYSRPDLTHPQHVALSDGGFLHAPGGGFREDSTFHARAYLERHWGELFSLRLYREHGLAAFQDLSVWERAADPATEN